MANVQDHGGDHGVYNYHASARNDEDDGYDYLDVLVHKNLTAIMMWIVTMRMDIVRHERL